VNPRKAALGVVSWVCWSPRRAGTAATVAGGVLIIAAGMGLNSCTASLTPRTVAVATPTTTAPTPTDAVDDAGAGAAQALVALWLAPRDAGWLGRAVPLAVPELAEPLATAAKLPPLGGRVTGTARRIGSDGLGGVFTVPTTLGPFTVTTALGGSGFVVAELIPPKP
jgi:hypothetical protein